MNETIASMYCPRVKPRQECKGEMGLRQKGNAGLMKRRPSTQVDVVD